MDVILRGLADSGLSLRGGFNLEPGEECPPGPSGRPARAVLLVGNVGAAFWSHFVRWREQQAQAVANPLDSWSRMVIGAAAREAGARAVLPNDRPFAPFQQWAMRAEHLRPSPLGILMHPEFGLWHAYRGALLFDEPLEIETASQHPHPCDGCAEKPCLTACPVSAHGLHGFAYRQCLDHVRGDGHRCREEGCLDRNACPAGTDFRYPATTQRFFMEAFAA
ncbi:MAG: hypothetical protein M9924_14180 [Rhizobiaceae bacterium]|nr:hypothetical protein [Rhizobiaceae bacterium]